jgi:hypothetical protein
VVLVGGWAVKLCCVDCILGTVRSSRLLRYVLTVHIVHVKVRTVHLYIYIYILKIFVKGTGSFCLSGFHPSCTDTMIQLL